MPARWSRLVLPVGFALGLAAGTVAGAIVGPQVASAALERTITSRAASVSGVPPACTTKPFPDVELSHPYCAEIAWLSANGITTGFAGGTYRPDDNTKRQTWAPFLARLLEASISSCGAVKPFTDVATSHPFCPQIQWMKAKGITTGYVDGTYRPADDAKRMAIAVFLARGAEAALTACGAVKPFTDVPTNHPFCSEIKWLGETGIFTGYGDGSFHPTESVTRGEAAALLYRTAYLLDAAPVLTTTGGTTPYTEGDPATVIDGGLTVADTDDTNLESAQVRLSSGFQATDDVLAFADTASITGSYNSGTGVLTLTGTDTVANYETALRSVTFDNTGTNPAAAKTVEFKVYDGTRESNAATQDLAITTSNDGPVITLSGSTPAYTEGGSVTLVDSGVTVTDADDTNLESGVVDISAGFQAGDVLGFSSPQNGISGAYNSGTGVLTLTGTSSVANYQTALASIDFSTTNDDPTASRTIQFKVNDGSADSNLPTKTIAITAVNDGPTNTVPASATVNEDTAFNFTGGDAVSVADPDSGTGALEIDLSVTNGTLTMTTLTGLTFTLGSGSGDAAMTFSGTLADVNGALATLRFDPTGNFPGMAASGIAVFSMTSDDQGNTGTGGALTDTDGFNITVNQVNDAPDAADQLLDTSSSIQITITAGDIGLLKDGTTDVDNVDGDLTVSATFTNVDPGANVFLTDPANGAYTYNPAPGFTGTDVFNYQVCDLEPLCDTASVTVTVGGVDLWFVDDSAAAGGTGRLTDPFDSLADLPAGRGTGDNIFLYSGTYSTGHTLFTSESLIGQATTGSGFDTLLGVSVPPNGTLDARPALNGSAATLQNTLNLATSAEVLGIAVSSGANTALSGSGLITGIDVGQTTLTTTTGTALSLNNVGGTVTLTDLDKDGSGTGISLTNVSANVTVPSGATIQNTTTGAIFLDGGAGNFSYAGSLANINSGREVTVQNKTVGSVVSFTGAIGTTGTPLGGTGILLDNNDQVGGSGGSVTFSGGVNLSTGANAAFTATNGGTVNVTGTNTLTTTLGSALAVTNTTIGASGLTFRSINVDGNDSAPTNGILINNTGSTGSLAVTGTGAASSGGTIQDTSGNGIDLIATSSPSLSWMRVTSNLGNGIHGGAADGSAAGQVSNATLTNLVVSNNGNDSGTEDGILFQGLVGTATWSNLDVSGSARHNVAVINRNGTLNSLTISGSGIHDNNSVGSSNGLTLIADETAVMTVSVGTTDFITNRVDGVLGQTTGAGTLTLSVSGGTFTNNFNSFVLEHASSGNLTGTLNGATITNTINGCSGSASPCGHQVNIFLGNQASSNANSILRATVTNNTINNGGSASGIGINVHTGTPVTGHVRALINNNTISNVQNLGINVSGGGCTGILVCNATIDATIENNNVATSGAAADHAIALSGATNVSDTIDFCVDIENNVASSTLVDGIRVRHRQSSTVRLPGYANTQFNTAAVVAYLDGRNLGTSDTITASTSSTGPGFIAGTCATP